MKKIVALIFILANINFASSQENIEIIPTLGFACYEDGGQTKAVGKFSILIKKQNYKAIRKSLSSKKSEEKFLAVVTLEKLEYLKKVELSEVEKQRIIEIRNSNQLITVCSGCIYFEELSLKNAFIVMESSAKVWLSNFL